MNHPSDYMPDYRDSQSSDSSNSHFCPQTHTNHTSSHKNKSQLSLIKPKIKHSGKQKYKKQGKSTVHQSAGKKKSKKEKEKPKIFDIFVYDGSFYSCGNVDEVSIRLKEKSTVKLNQKIISEYRLRRKEQRCLSKIQKYLKGFLLSKQTKKPALRPQQRLQLYTLLKQEQQVQSDQNIVYQILRKTLEKLQQKCEKLQLIYPAQNEVIHQWKNIKMHQLMTAQSFLLQEKQLNLDVFQLNRELQVLNEEEFFPEMRQQAHQLQKQIITHIQSQKQVHTNSKFEDERVKWVISRFLAFIQQREDIWSFIAQILYQYQYGYKDRPIITEEIYIEFQNSQLNLIQHVQEVESSKVYQSCFNKAVADLINQAAFQSRDIYPALQCLRKIIDAAKIKLTEQQHSVWLEESLLEIDNLIFEQLLEDALTDILHFF